MHISQVKVTEGRIPFIVQGETVETWYTVHGDIATRNRRPLVVLHGGPGMSHDYMLPVCDLAQSSIPVILYDQLGSARSTRLPHKDASFWKIDIFIAELLNLLFYFEIENDFDLLGHSWGGILGVEFCIRQQPAGLKHLILANTPAATCLREESHARLRERLPKDVQVTLMDHKNVGSSYIEAMDKFITRFWCTLRPMPDSLMVSLKQTQFNSISKSMRDGDLKDWEPSDMLNRVQVPTLLINGKDDVIQDFASAPFFWKIRQVKWVQFSESSHVPHMEEREKFMEMVNFFVSL